MILLVVDIQKGITDERLYDYDGFLQRVTTLIAAARKSHAEVIFFQHDDGPGSGFSVGDADFEIAGQVKPLAEEKVFVKTMNSCFSNAEFVTYLEEKKDKQLMIIGLQTNFCIDATVKSAFERGYQVMIPQGTNSTMGNDYMNAETTYKYYNEMIWPEHFAKIIPMEEALSAFPDKELADTVGSFLKGMGRLTKDLAATVSNKVIPGVDKVVAAIDQKAQQAIRQSIEQNPGHLCFTVEDLKAEKKDSYRVVNERKEMKFQVRKVVRKGKAVYVVHDFVGREVGSVRDTKLVLSEALPMDNGKRTYELYQGEAQIGEVHAKGTGLIKVMLHVPGKTLIGNAQEMEFWVIADTGEVTLSVSRKALENVPNAYLLEVSDPKTDLACLLMSIAINLAGNEEDENKTP
ncbi:MAG: isochorismatase family protein [Lachnospiraceae bacterium]|nr:isochorismatase family protein [Lachnospiraceae bacterium]